MLPEAYCIIVIIYTCMTGLKHHIMGTVYIYIFGPDIIIICKEVYVSLEVPVHQD